jgi:hypothetical protein
MPEQTKLTIIPASAGMMVGAWVPLLACPAVRPKNTASKLAVAPKYVTEFMKQST